MRAGQDLPVRLTYENRPLAGALVVAMNRLNPAEKLTARTDADGRVRFRLRPGGMWLIKAVHMVPAPAGAHAEWASFWASLTFEMRNRAAAADDHGHGVTDTNERSRARGSWLSRGARRAVLRRRARFARTRSARRACRFCFDEGRTYDVEIVTDAAALVEKLEASSGESLVCRPSSRIVCSRCSSGSTRRFAGE